MRLSELITTLQSFQQELGYDADPEVRLAIQPQWSFEHSIDAVALVTAPPTMSYAAYEALSEDEQESADERADRDELLLLEEDEEAPEPIVYIGEGGQVGYLPGNAARELGW